ncbi:type II secretion system secretin GspD [Antarcticirhabdus aurantiaca]|uniref:Type II secretion system secretin GspD n=1 Tax=Antarcticirhabdus aurantiaca TaxID=2606717 RepID=A0ACD4NM98_9HYPH|nr:type II secretion system secretin GspD [Antarcticirhabdus aurantiaca]WAJ27830.1 type II secretion system secretin GspD [Jeongeuplla avenae]
MADRQARRTQSARRRERGFSLSLALCVLLSGCASEGGGRSGLEATRSLGHPRGPFAGAPAMPSAYGAPSRSLPGEVRLATGAPVMRGPLYRDNGQTVTLDLVDVPLAVAASTIFTEILRANYVIADEAQGTVTLQTARPVSKQALVDSFQSVLATKGLAIVKVGEVYRIAASQDPMTTGSLSFASRGSVQVGKGARIVPLVSISAAEMERILAPIAPAGVIRADRTRNILVLSGTAEEIRSMEEAVQLFDTDWMRGMSAAIYPLSGGGDPGAIAKQLEELFGGANGPMEGAMRFLPSRELGAILVISANPRYIERARSYILKLDQVAAANAPQTFVYRVENRPAKELAAIVQGMVSGVQGADGVAGGLTPLRSAIGLGDGNANGEDADPAAGSAGVSTLSGGPVSVVADEPNNALIIVATKAQYDRILPVLTSSDRMANQVLVEAVIAEVTLNDQLRFGLRWFFESSNGKARLTDAASGTIATVAPGFSYFFSNVNFQVALNALSSITKVKVISSPTLTVLDNRTARLQIGDQVPVVTQTATSTQGSADAPIVNRIEMKDTGVILSVTPRVNSNGNVLLNIEQEVSDVVRTTSSGIDSPTIRQRKIATTVVVEDGQSIALGGLVQEKRERGTEAVPVLGQLPVLGPAFRNRTDAVVRTELVIFIRPRVMRNGSEAQAVTREFRQGLSRLGLDMSRGETPVQRIAR